MSDLQTASSPVLDSEKQKDFMHTRIADRLLERFSRPIEDFSKPELIDYLQRDLKELRGMDPMIPIINKLQDGSWDPEENTIQLGSYRISHPSIKALNDTYLGPMTTDGFIANLHEQIRTTFRDDFEVLRHFFKGGTFSLHLPKTADTVAHLEQLREAMNQFHLEATNILLRHISEHLTAYESSLSETEIQVNHLSTPAIETLLESSSFSEKQKELLTSYFMLRRFHAAIAEGTIPVEISFGINQSRSVKPKELAFALCCAERAANMGAYRSYRSRKQGEDQDHERNPLQEYSHEYLFADLITARSRIQALTTEGKGDAMRVRPKWQPFFELDDQNQLRMTETMIAMHRKGHYSETLDPMMIDVFANYYAAINEVDVLRNFRVADVDRYLERSQNISDLIDRVEMALDTPELPKERLAALLHQTSQELEISIKNERENISQTQRAVIRALMADGAKVLLMGDHISFGVRNVQSNERFVTGLISQLELSPDEIGLSSRDHQAFLSILKTRFKAMPLGYWDKLFAIGDPGTAYLRQAEKALFDHFGGRAICDADGGDELTLVIPLSSINLPDEAVFHRGLQPDATPAEQNRLKLAINHELTKILAKWRIRAAAVLMPGPLRPGDGQKYTEALCYAEKTYQVLKDFPDVFVRSKIQN